MSNPAKPKYPIDKHKGVVTLPPEIDEKLRDLLGSGKKIEAIQEVLHLTGAGLKLSKDYVDALEKALKK